MCPYSFSDRRSSCAMCRLANILKKRSLSSEKLDQIKIKANVLAAFAEKKAKDTAEAAADVVEDAAEAVESAAHHYKEEL